MVTTGRFNFFMMRNTHEWFLLSCECLCRVSYMVLCGDFPPTLALTREQALAVVYKVIDWHRSLRQDGAWLPMKSIVFLFLFVFSSLIK